MASVRKSFFVVPSWDITPTEVALGSIIASIKTPHRALSAIPLPIQNELHIPKPTQEKEFSGTLKRSKESDIGVFASFINVIAFGGEISRRSSSTLEVKYSCSMMETHKFTPSPSYISEAIKGANVKEYLKMGGHRAKVFMVTGVKTASNITITTTEETEEKTTIKIGLDASLARVAVGPKGSHNTSEHSSNTRTIEGPIVFAFQVEKIRINRKGKTSSQEYVDGAMLSRHEGDADDYTFECLGQELDDDEVDDFMVDVRLGYDEVTGDLCKVIIP